MSDAPSVAWWDSKTARLLNLGAGVAAVVILCRLAVEEEVAWVGWLVFGSAVVVLLLACWPYGALIVLTGMSAAPVFAVEIFGWKSRPEHFAAAATLVAVCIWLRVRKRELPFEKLDYWLLAYVAINYASSILGSSAPSFTLRWALQNNLAILPYFLIRILVRDLETFRKAFFILLTVGVVESIYGILCYASHQAFDTVAGVSVGQYLVDVAAPYGSMYEPNLFGAYTACCAVICLALYLDQGKHRIGYLVCFLIVSLGTVLSFSRAALLALMVAVIWVLWKGRRRRLGADYALAIAAVVLALTLVITVTPIGGVAVERLTNLYYQGLTEETTITRFFVLAEALGEVQQHVLLGTGTASFQLSFDWARYVPAWADVPVWIGNSVIRILHDTGLLGLTAFLGFIVSLWSKSRPLLKSNGPLVVMLFGLSAGALVYFISFQFTDGTTLAFFWVHMGFLASAAVILNSRNKELSNVGKMPSRVA